MRFHLIYIIIIALLVMPIANASPLTYADYAELPAKSMVVISPSGNILAFRKTTEDRDNFIIFDITKGEIVTAVDVRKVDPDNAYFIDDERLILKVSKNKRIFGYTGIHDLSVAYSFDINTNKLHQLLVAGDGIYEGQSAVGNIVGVSEDHRFAYMPAWKNQSQYSLYKVSLKKQKTPRVYQQGTSDTIDFFVDNKNNVLARERYNNKENLHQLEARIDDEWVVIFKEEDAEVRHVAFVGVTPDSQKLVMTQFNSAHGRWAYYTIALKDGTISEAIFSREDRDVENVLTDINRVVYGVRYSGFKPSYEFFDEKLNARINGIKKALPEFSLSINDYTPDWSNIILHMDGGGNSGSYLQYKNGKLSMLAASRPKIKGDHVHAVQEIAYKARDGMNIPALLTLPTGKAIENLPLIVLPHGGPASYDKIGFDWLSQYFTSQGYLVVQPQFRGSKGFGNKHLEAGRGQWGRKMQDDLTDAVNLLVKEGKADANRVCIVGASYGGYAALAGAAFTPEVYKCAVSIAGVSDIPQMLEEDRDNFGDEHWVVSYWDRVISNGNLEKDHLEKISPINSVKNIKAPVLLIHGRHDLIVSFDQSDDMFDEMEDEDKDVTFVELERGNHHLTDPKNRAKTLEAIDKFLKKHL